MRSIREWKAERVISEGEFSNRMADGNPEIDGRLEMEFKPKVLRVMDMFKSTPRGDLLNKMGAAISKAIAEIGGGKSVRDNRERPPSGFADMMGDEGTGADSDMEGEIKPKVERIMDMPDFKSMPKDELERNLMAIATKFVNREGSRGDNLPTSRHDDDPIAKESRFVPSFLRWAEQNEDQMGSLSEPQHEVGEKDMDLKSTVEKKMMELAQSLVDGKKGSKQEILAAMKAVVDSASSASDQNKNQQQGQNQDQPPEQAQTPAQGRPAPKGGGPQDSAPALQGPVVN